jgi:hypothetical protein
MMRIALFVATFALAVVAQSESACKRRVTEFAFGDAVHAATQARLACVADDWLLWFYTNNRPVYDAWVSGVQKTLGIEETLSHLSLRACLRTFLKADFSGENLAFLDQVMLYKTITTQDVISQKACEIYANYVVPTAAKQINLSSDDTKKLNTALGGCPNPAQATLTVFDDAADAIKSLIRRDCFSRFRKSKEYADCVGKTMVEKQLRNFGAILDAFCEDEEKVYEGRLDADKVKVQALVRSHWEKKCKADNTFVPPPVTRARS